jgi:hypothetical protein
VLGLWDKFGVEEKIVGWILERLKGSEKVISFENLIIPKTFLDENYLKTSELIIQIILNLSNQNH